MQLPSPTVSAFPWQDKNVDVFVEGSWVVKSRYIMYNIVECYQVCTGVYLANGIQNDDGSTLIHFRLLFLRWSFTILSMFSALSPDAVSIYGRCSYSVFISGSGIDCLPLLLFVAVFCAGACRYGYFVGRSVHFIEKHADAYNGGGTHPVAL